MLPPLFWALLATLACLRAVLRAGVDPGSLLVGSVATLALGVTLAVLLRAPSSCAPWSWDGRRGWQGRSAPRRCPAGSFGSKET